MPLQCDQPVFLPAQTAGIQFFWTVLGLIIGVNLPGVKLFTMICGLPALFCLLKRESSSRTATTTIYLVTAYLFPHRISLIAAWPWLVRTKQVAYLSRSITECSSFKAVNKSSVFRSTNLAMKCRSEATKVNLGRIPNFVADSFNFGKSNSARRKVPITLNDKMIESVRFLERR